MIEKETKIIAYEKLLKRPPKDYEEDKIFYFYIKEYDVMKRANALVPIIEWNQFRRLDLERIKDLIAEPVFFEISIVYEPNEVEQYGIDYIALDLS